MFLNIRINKILRTDVKAISTNLKEEVSGYTYDALSKVEDLLWL